MPRQPHSYSDRGCRPGRRQPGRLLPQAPPARGERTGGDRPGWAAAVDLACTARPHARPDRGPHSPDHPDLRASGRSSPGRPRLHGSRTVGDEAPQTPTGPWPHAHPTDRQPRTFRGTGSGRAWCRTAEVVADHPQGPGAARIECRQSLQPSSPWSGNALNPRHRSIARGVRRDPGRCSMLCCSAVLIGGRFGLRRFGRTVGVSRLPLRRWCCPDRGHTPGSGSRRIPNARSR